MPTGEMNQVLEETKLADKMRDINEALVLSALRQHEHAATLEVLNAKLQAEIVERQRVETALRESEAYSQSAFEANPDCVKIIGSDGHIERMNANGQRLMELDAFGRVSGAYWPSLWPPESQAGIEVAIAEARNGGSGHFTGFCPTAKGTPKWWEVLVTAIPGASAAPDRLIASSRDITERKLAEQRRIMLTRELAHRGNNMMAVIQAIVSRTLRGNLKLSEARDVLMNRLRALARSQSALLSEGFIGAPLSEIVRLEFEAYPAQVKSAGPRVMLNPRVAQNFALVMHELATNAFKYGALSQPDGQVAITWSIDDAETEAKLRFTWRELNGPLVTPPTRKGFGSIMLQDVMAQEFGSLPKTSYNPDGLIYEFEVLLPAIIAGEPPL